MYWLHPTSYQRLTIAFVSFVPGSCAKGTGPCEQILIAKYTPEQSAPAFRDACDFRPLSLTLVSTLPSSRPRLDTSHALLHSLHSQDSWSASPPESLSKKMRFTSTFVTVLAVLPVLIEAYNPFPVDGHSYSVATGAAGHKMIKRRVGKRVCATKAKSSSSGAVAAATSPLAAVQAIASKPAAVSSAATSSAVASSSSSAAPAPAPTGGDASLPAAVAGPFTGDGTFYNPGMGACGKTNGPGDPIVAVSAALFDQFPGNTGNPNTNPICDRKLLITYKGVTAQATVRDRCPECAIGSLDMTESLFNEFAASSVGRLSDSIGTGSISWVWA